jgi:nitrate reductase gamma subunit
MKALYALLAVVVLAVLALVGVQVLGLRFLFGIIVPYVAIGIFFAGLIYRVLKWAGAPVPFHVPTVCGQQKSLPWIKDNNVESPSTTGGVVKRMALEVLLFRSLFRNDKFELRKSQKLAYAGSRFLWLGGLAFHWSLFIILFRHLRLFTEPVPSIVLFVTGVDGILQQPWPVLYITDIVLLIALTYLFVRRVLYPRLRYISLPGDYLAPMLILAVAVCGVLMRLVYKVDTTAVKELAIGVITFHPAIPPGIGVIFYVHLFLVSSLLAYFPFSKLVHGPGVLLSPTRNLKNNSRMKRHVNPWNRPVPVHTYAEYEDEFRDRMKKAGLPVERDN